MRAARGLYALSAWPFSEHRRLLAACLTTGGTASHQSAAWLWGLVEQAPTIPVVSVPAEQRPRRQILSAGAIDLRGFVVQRCRDLALSTASTRDGIPTTNPLRTIVDVAGTSPPTLLDEALDAALASRLVTVEGLLAEAQRLKRSGRRGPSKLTDQLRRRAFSGAPRPSVLEARTLRLLKSARVAVSQCEVVVDEGRYRLDVQLGERLFIEVDGYAFHWGPEHKAYDDARRNRLRLLGLVVLVYSWRDVVNDGPRMVREALAVVAALGAQGENRPAQRA